LKFENQYIIQFKGLKEGVHDFKFTISKPFFEEFEHLEVPDGDLDVAIELSKNAGFLELLITLRGQIHVQCDRCLGYFKMPLDYKGHLVVRFDENPQEPDDEVMVLYPDDHQLNLKQYLYECISISIPYKKVHPELPNGETACDPEMLKRLNEHLIKE
jgi:uncharacterized metal-binding protein YceD (DUF177 family)